MILIVERDFIYRFELFDKFVVCLLLNHLIYIFRGRSEFYSVINVAQGAFFLPLDIIFNHNQELLPDWIISWILLQPGSRVYA